MKHLLFTMIFTICFLGCQNSATLESKKRSKTTFCNLAFLVFATTTEPTSPPTTFAEAEAQGEIKVLRRYLGGACLILNNAYNNQKEAESKEYTPSL